MKSKNTKLNLLKISMALQICVDGYESDISKL